MTEGDDGGTTRTFLDKMLDSRFRRGGITLAKVANAVGYESTSQFSQESRINDNGNVFLNAEGNKLVRSRTWMAKRRKSTTSGLRFRTD